MEQTKDWMRESAWSISICPRPPNRLTGRAPAAASSSCGVYTGKHPTAFPEGLASFHAATLGKLTSVVSSAQLSTNSSQLFACSQLSTASFRSEERRVGKEGRSRWAPYH